MGSAPTYDCLYERLVKGEEKLALIGLGYVGMPIAVEFAKHVKVIGFNHNENRIQQYKSGIVQRMKWEMQRFRLRRLTLHLMKND